VSDILARIVAQTRIDVAARKATTPLEALLPKVAVAPRARIPFRDALRTRELHLIAEYKPRSPSRGELRPGVTPSDVIPHYDRSADAISVLCDAPFFGGGYDLLRTIRAMTSRPLLCKDFIVDEYQLLEARAAGADAVLLMASVLDSATLAVLYQRAASLGLDALVETHTEDELDRVLALDCAIVGVNSRDLRTMSINHNYMYSQLAKIPNTCLRVAESGFGTRTDVDGARRRVDAILMGSELMSAPDIAARLAELGF
jgi:indole-3-glycerol phosphate synthase